MSSSSSAASVSASARSGSGRKASAAPDEMAERGYQSARPPIDDEQRKRIRARRNRIDNTREKQRKEALGIKEEPPKKDENPHLKPQPEKGDAKMNEAKKILGDMIEAGFEKVTHVRVASDFSEAERRQKEEEERVARTERLEQEQDETIRAYENIASRWEHASELSDMEELDALLQEQKSACDGLISSKQSVIDELKAFLKTRDDDYIRNLRAQATDIDSLLATMNEQVNDLMRQFKTELADMEEAFMDERQELIEATRKEWFDALNLRNRLEEKFLEDARNRIETHSNRLQHLHDTSSDEYNDLRRKLEDEIDRLQLQLQETKAIHQMNTEKLDYNYHVLKKREEENAVAVSQQKRRLNKLRDTMNDLKKKRVQQEQQLQAENVALTEDYTRVVSQHQDLKHKARHFQAVDMERYDAIYDMNAETHVKIARKLLDADRCIFEQQLGLQWVPPVDAVFDPNLSNEQVESLCSAKDMDNKRAAGEEVDETASPEAISDETLQRVFDLLCLEGNFLIEDKLLKLLETMTPGQQRLIRVDAILKGLGVESEQDIRLLASKFLVHDSNGHEGANEEQTSPAAAPSSEVEEQPADDDVDGPRLIPRHQVAETLREFVQEQKARQRTRERKTGGQPKRRDLGYWERLTKVLPLEHSQLYATLQENFGKYEQVLKDRKKLLEETDRLRNQNGELRMLLQQYMTSKVNNELVIPPTDVLAHQVRMHQTRLQESQQHSSASSS